MMDKMLAAMGIKYLANKFNGKKAYVGAAGLALTGLSGILIGVAGIIGHVYPDSGLPGMEIDKGIDAIVAGFGVISGALTGVGLRHALTKVDTDVKVEQ